MISNCLIPATCLKEDSAEDLPSLTDDLKIPPRSLKAFCLIYITTSNLIPFDEGEQLSECGLMKTTWVMMDYRE